MNEPQKPTPEQAFNFVAQMVQEIPAKVGEIEKVTGAHASLLVLKELVEASIKARQAAAENIPGVVPKTFPVEASS